jgi:hypothetical protein
MNYPNRSISAPYNKTPGGFEIRVFEFSSDVIAQLKGNIIDQINYTGINFPLELCDQAFASGKRSLW